MEYLNDMYSLYLTLHVYSILGLILLIVYLNELPFLQLRLQGISCPWLDLIHRAYVKKIIIACIMPSSHLKLSTTVPLLFNYDIHIQQNKQIKNPEAKKRRFI